MLDTNIISDLVKNPTGRAANRIRALPNDAVATSIIVASELRYGCARKASSKLLRQVEAVLSGMEILPLDVPADAECGAIRSELEAAGQSIGHNDLFIAAHAYALRMTLVTDNVREFSSIRGLRVENWLE
jgi:tRNA(fMet)-specific endonuclease VapC